ncbi:MAG: urocanate hydratase, partial [Flavobacteriales bacterium]
MDFKAQILQGIPSELPAVKSISLTVNRAPKRKEILSLEEKKLAIRNALRYFPAAWHKVLSVEFAQELQDYGRIYMYRFKPDYEL